MAKIFGQLEKAQLENTTSDTASLPKGMATYRTDLNVAKISDGTVMKTLVDTDTTQTLAGKTLTSPTINSGVLNTPTVDVISATEQGSTPSNPSAGTRKLYVKTDGKAYLLNSAGTETALGSGGAGGINYITNGDAEVNTTGWTTYDDGNTNALPIDGVGGSPTLTWTRTTTTPLRGAASFLLTKGASNQRGQGVTFPFTIDLTDRGTMQTITADVMLISGTYDEGTQTTPSDLTVYIYDVTNAVLLNQPAAYRILPGAVNLGAKVVVEFQASSNSSSYRLIFHQALSGTSAYSLEFDNITVGPSRITRGALITNPQPYTPVVTGLGTITGVDVSYRQVGGFLEVTGRVTAGTPSATALYIGLPSGFSMPTRTTSQQVGIGTRSSGAANANKDIIILNGSFSTTQVGVSLRDTTAVIDPIVVQNGDTIFGSGNVFTFQFSVPILGWSSSQQLSSDAGQRSIVFRASTSTARTVNNTSPVVIYETVTKDSIGAYNAATGEYTVRESGDYKFGGAMRTVAHTSTVGFATAMTLWRNGVQVSTFSVFRSQITASIVYGLNGSDTLFFNAGDVLTWRLYSDDATTLASGVPLENYIYLEKIQSPQQLAASEKIFLSVGKSSAQTITTSTATVLTNWDAPLIDSTGSFNVTTGIYTVQRAGVAVISLQYAFVGNATGTRSGAIRLNGSDVSLTEYQGSSSSTEGNLTKYVTPVKAGDTIDFRVNQTSGGNLNTVASAVYNRATVEIT